MVDKSHIPDMLFPVFSVTTESCRIIVARKKEIYALPTALCVKIFRWKVLNNDMVLPVFWSQDAAEAASVT